MQHGPDFKSSCARVCEKDIYIYIKKERNRKKKRGGGGGE